MILAAILLLFVVGVVAALPAPRPRHNWQQAFSNWRAAALQAELQAELLKRLRDKGASREQGKVVRLEPKQTKQEGRTG